MSTTPTLKEIDPDTARRIRIRAGISQERLAARIGCSVNSLRRWEKGLFYPSELLRDRYRKALDELREASNDC